MCVCFWDGVDMLFVICLKHFWSVWGCFNTHLVNAVVWHWGEFAIVWIVLRVMLRSSRGMFSNCLAHVFRRCWGDVVLHLRWAWDALGVFSNWLCGDLAVRFKWLMDFEMIWGWWFWGLFSKCLVNDLDDVEGILWWCWREFDELLQWFRSVVMRMLRCDFEMIVQTLWSCLWVLLNNYPVNVSMWFWDGFEVVFSVCYLFWTCWRWFRSLFSKCLANLVMWCWIDLKWWWCDFNIPA